MNHRLGLRGNVLYWVFGLSTMLSTWDCTDSDWWRVLWMRYLAAPLTLRSVICPLGLLLQLNGNLQMVIGGSQTSYCRLSVAIIQLRYLRGSHWIRGSPTPSWFRPVCVSRFAVPRHYAPICGFPTDRGTATSGYPIHLLRFALCLCSNPVRY